jgi:hypothetical protein
MIWPPRLDPAHCRHQDRARAGFAPVNQVRGTQAVFNEGRHCWPDACRGLSLRLLFVMDTVSTANARAFMIFFRVAGRFHMSTPQPADEFSKGMQTIERAIVEGVLKTGRHISTTDLRWYRGHALMPRPNMIDLQLRIGNRAAGGIFSRDEIEDAADRVDRAQTLRTIQRIIDEASGFPR